MRIVVAVAIGIMMFVVSGFVLLLAGAMSFRLLLGVSTYRSSGTYIGVLVFGIVGATAVSAVSVWGVLRSRDNVPPR